MDRNKSAAGGCASVEEALMRAMRLPLCGKVNTAGFGEAAIRELITLGTGVVFTKRLL
jgi:hypothetical protein